MELVIFSDLDGSLLDHDTYSHAEAAPALAALKARGSELVLCSSKTHAEMLPLWRELGLGSPLISENGGGVFLPPGHALAGEPADWTPEGEGWLGLRLGLAVAEVRARLKPVSARFGVRGFGDMDAAEVAALTGLSLAQAALALEREFDEPVLLARPEDDAADFTAEVMSLGLSVVRGGRFWHVMGGCDKGRSVRLLSGLYRHRNPGLVTAALGDAENDFPMLAAVDRPILLARPGGGHAPLDLPGLVRTAWPGPRGWNQAILDLLGTKP